MKDRSTPARNHLAASSIDRAAHLRGNEDALSDMLRSGRARIVLVSGDRVGMTDDGPRVAAIEPGLLPWGSPDPFFLGITGDGPLFAVDVTGGPAGRREGPRRLPEKVQFRPLRSMAPSLAAEDAGVAAYAMGLCNWHRATPRCCGCGEPTAVKMGGHVRFCAGCNREHFPRTDPAVIMLVSDGDRCLLSHQAEWPGRMYSTLAGFVEPGESLETAVIREVKEETGVAVSDVRYHSSQPWPFPASLMIGFTARYEAGEVTPQSGEILDARWFSRAGLDAAIRRQEVSLPPRVSIAYRLIRDWMGSAP
ncbi:MAG TPA: NAD(+) diphosphatase [Actinomycetota bacterium]|jgi:NAD+ diphosphatase|nr:NAD(+) diphosphatase [Actinomycetota bacterium]